jgi:hypothetical protein
MHTSDFTPDADAIRVGQGLDTPLPAQPQTRLATLPPATIPNPPSQPLPGRENLANPAPVLPARSPLDTSEAAR